MEYEKRIDFQRCLDHRTLDGKLQAFDKEIERVGYVCLTDVAAHRGMGGEYVLEILGEEYKDRSVEPRKWKLQVLCDAWGDVPKPGDVVTRKVTRQFKDRAGRKLRSRAVNQMIIQGGYDKAFVQKFDFVVDEKGCIECDFESAGDFLMDYGVHFETGEGLGGRRELSGGPCKAPDGSIKHVRYWRYKEAPPWVYDKLPVLTKKRKKKQSSTSPTQNAAAVDGGQNEHQRSGIQPADGSHTGDVVNSTN
jgi:hypothetical protein